MRREPQIIEGHAVVLKQAPAVAPQILFAGREPLPFSDLGQAKQGLDDEGGARAERLAYAKAWHGSCRTAGSRSQGSLSVAGRVSFRNFALQRVREILPLEVLMSHIGGTT